MSTTIEQLQKQLADAQALTEQLQRELEEASKPKQSPLQQWNPEGGEWFIRNNGCVDNVITVDDFRLFGTERKTKEQAEKAAKAMRTFNRLLAYRDEFDPDFEEVWDYETYNYCVVYSVDLGEYMVDGYKCYKTVGVVYMSESVAEELAKKLNNGSVEL